MTLHEAVKQLAEDEKMYCATLRRSCWHPRVTVWFEFTLGADVGHLFYNFSADDDGTEILSIWNPTIADILADDWIIKSTEKF